MRWWPPARVRCISRQRSGSVRSAFFPCVDRSIPDDGRHWVVMPMRWCTIRTALIVPQEDPATASLGSIRDGCWTCWMPCPEGRREDEQRVVQGEEGRARLRFPGADTSDPILARDREARLPELQTHGNGMAIGVAGRVVHLQLEQHLLEPLPQFVPVALQHVRHTALDGVDVILAERHHADTVLAQAFGGEITDSRAPHRMALRIQAVERTIAAPHPGAPQFLPGDVGPYVRAVLGLRIEHIVRIRVATRTAEHPCREIGR